jgi:hypothetical protein
MGVGALCGPVVLGKDGSVRCVPRSGPAPNREVVHSVTDPVPDVGHLGGVDHLSDLQLDERGQDVEEAATAA